MSGSIYRVRTASMVAAALVAALAATSANASVIPATDLNDVTLGNLVASDSSSFETATFGSFAGTIDAEVHENNGLFTYSYEVTPEFHFWHVMHSPTNLLGVDENSVAGYDFGQASAANEPDWNIVFNEGDGSLKWEIPGSDTRVSDWRADDPITFFYQSEYGPATTGIFGTAWGGSGAEAVSIVPIPEPATASLLGLLGLAMMRRRRSRA